MKVTGLIAEYNPFHNGHAYHLKKARELTGADYIIAVMSGNFVQRGEPAIINKYARAKMALSCGVDLVLELPACYACGSAEYFAGSAVALLNQLGIVDSICFGSECGDLSLLSESAQILAFEPEEYQTSLASMLKKGLTFPGAREKALQKFLSSEALKTLSSPNNILAIEYLKALIRQRSPIKPYSIPRITSGYHQQTLCSTEGISSATAIRRELFLGNRNAASHMPEASYDLLSHALNQKMAVTSDDFSLPLHYRLLHTDAGQLLTCLDISPDLADRMVKLRSNYTSFENFVKELKTKQMTETRIRRTLIHVLLSIRTDEVLASIQEGWHSYIRILGFRREAAPLLRQIKQNSALPMVSRLTADKKSLSPSALRMLNQDIRCSEIYESAVTAKSGCGPYNEHSRPLVLL